MIYKINEIQSNHHVHNITLAIGLIPACPTIMTQLLL